MGGGVLAGLVGRQRGGHSLSYSGPRMVGMPTAGGKLSLCLPMSGLGKVDGGQDRSWCLRLVGKEVSWDFLLGASACGGGQPRAPFGSYVRR